MRWLISMSLLFVVETLHASPISERYRVIGVLSGKHPLIVLRDNDLVKTFFLRSGEKLPHNSEFHIGLNAKSKIILTAKNEQHILDFQDAPTSPSPELKKLVKSSEKALVDNKKLEEYYDKYLMKEGFGIQRDPNDFGKSILEIPGEDVTELITMEELL